MGGDRHCGRTYHPCRKRPRSRERKITGHKVTARLFKKAANRHSIAIGFGFVPWRNLCGDPHRKS